MIDELMTQGVQFPGFETTVRGYLARPATDQPRPALLVLHEWWGLNEHIQDLARRFAREGYVALAPDLYSRYGSPVTQDPQEASALMQKLPSQAALKDLNAAMTYLRSQSFVDPQQTGAVGFSMGASFSLMMAAHNSDLKASVAFYGQIPPQDSLKYLICPVLYLWGDQDGWVTKADVARLEAGLKQFGRPGEVVTYPGCPHAFFNDTRKAVYREAEARDAWQRTPAFLRQHLGSIR